MCGNPVEKWGMQCSYHDPESKSNPKDDILEHQIAAFDWVIGRCEDQFVRAWLVSEREQLRRAGSTPDYY